MSKTNIVEDSNSNLKKRNTQTLKSSYNYFNKDKKSSINSNNNLNSNSISNKVLNHDDYVYEEANNSDMIDDYKSSTYNNAISKIIPNSEKDIKYKALNSNNNKLEDFDNLLIKGKVNKIDSNKKNDITDMFIIIGINNIGLEHIEDEQFILSPKVIYNYPLDTKESQLE